MRGRGRNSEYLHAGDLQHRAMLQAKTLTPDGAGGFHTAWYNKRVLKCEVTAMSVLQRMENMRRNSPVTHEVKARYADDINEVEAPKHRLIYEGMALNIVGSVRFGPRRESVHMFAVSGVAT